MGRLKKNAALSVYYTDELVGTLCKASTGALSFQYSEKWLSEGGEISRSLLLREQPYRGEIASRFFDNLLPDNDDLKTIIAEKFGAESKRPFDLLAVIGRDCVGALSFAPEGEGPPPRFQMDFRPISETEIAQRIRQLGSVNPLGMTSEDFRISIAGAQEKTALLLDQGRWCEPIGFTPTTHIIKSKIGALGSDIIFDDSVDNERASLYIFEQLGLETCQTQIAEFEDQRVLLVKRFDRAKIEIKKEHVWLRLFQEDMCQALGYSPYKKYQNSGGPGILEISEILSASKNHDDKINFFKALIIFDLLFAIDGHAKNFSIFLEPDGFCLTPFYDVMSGFFLTKKSLHIKTLKFAMKVGNSGHYKIDTIHKRHYEETAKKMGLSSEEIDVCFHELYQNYKNIDLSASHIDPLINPETVATISEGMHLRAKRLF